MNIGQVLEIHLSLAAKALGFNIATPVFDGANEDDIMDTLELANDYVNLSWEEFSERHKKNCSRKYMIICMKTENAENCGKVFRFPAMVK